MSSCHVCGAAATKRCCAVPYCSRACQAKDRRAHAPACVAGKKEPAPAAAAVARMARRVDEAMVRDWQMLEKLVALHAAWRWPVATTSKVRVEQDAVLGKVLVAATAMDAHEVALVESPLFLYVKYPELERTAQSILLAFSKLTETKRRFILSFYFCPEVTAPGAASAVEIYSRVIAGQSDVKADDAMKAGDFHSLSWSDGFPQILLITHANSHLFFGFYNASNMSFAALFETSSKVEHSCKPNLMFTTFDSGVLKHTTLRRIEAGERLSVSYSTTVEMPVAERRDILLKSKFFVCRCELCRSEVDATAALQCSHCRGPVRQTEARGAWKCGKCKQLVSDPSRLPPHEWANGATCRLLLRLGAANPFRGIESVVWREQAEAGMGDAPEPFSLAEEERRRDDAAAAAKLEREFARRPPFFGGTQEALFCGQDLNRQGMARTARVVLRRYYVYCVAFLGENNADVRAVKALL